nr:hypothetical protein [uncultured bacterium]
MLAKTIDDVVKRLDAIIRESMREESRLGYFAALYNRVTQQVRAGIGRGEYEDCALMERLTVVFGNRYLVAYDQYRAGEMPGRAWLQTFDAARRDDLMVVQHLALGMNAHIDLDLGVAAARVCPDGALPRIHNDFLRINAVLSSLVPLVEEECEEASPLLAKVLAAAGGLERKACDWGLSLARGNAWSFAEHLVPLPLRDQVQHIADRDVDVARIGEVVLHQPAAMFLHLGESDDVRANIEILARGELSLLRKAG